MGVPERRSRSMPEGFRLVQCFDADHAHVLTRKGKVRRELKDRAYHYEPTLSHLEASGQAVLGLV